MGWFDTYLPLIVPAFTGGGAFSIFLIKQFFEAIPNELVESSKIDGAGWFTIFWKMFLPNSKPVLLVVIIFAFVNSWNDFFCAIDFLNQSGKIYRCHRTEYFQKFIWCRHGYCSPYGNGNFVSTSNSSSFCFCSKIFCPGNHNHRIKVNIFQERRNLL